MKLLLATDGSDTSRAAGDFLTRLPLPQGSDVTVLNVIRDTYFKYEEWEEWEGITDEHREELGETKQLVRKEREELVSGEAELLRSAGLACSTEVRIGQPADEIVHAAGSIGADLVVLGSVGRSGFHEFHMGRVSNAVLEYAPHSVLIVKQQAVEAAVPPESEQPPFRVLIAFDGSKSARKAVDFCRSLPLDERSEVHIFGVLRLMHGYRQDIQQRLSEVWRQKKAAAHKALDTVSKAETWSTPHVTSELRESASVTTAILDVANKRKIDLIVLGNKGKSAIEKFLLGSGSRRIMQHAPCSVVAVRS